MYISIIQYSSHIVYPKNIHGGICCAQNKKDTLYMRTRDLQVSLLNPSLSSGMELCM